MIFFGILSLVQILFLPGILSIRLLKPGGGFLQRLIFIVGFSLILNYLLVFLLTLLGAYLQPVMLVIVFVEITTILYLFRSEVKSPVRESFAVLWRRIETTIKKLLLSEADDNLFTLFRRYVLLISTFIAVAVLIHMGQIFIQNIPSVFNTYDAIVSWNNWASDWASNTIPLGTEDYPQLGPSMFSLTYVITGSNNVQFFAKALMPLFLTLIMLMFFDLGLEKPSFGILLGVEIVYLTIKHFVGEYINDGYMDIPLAFFAFLAVYALLKSRLAGNGRNTFLIILFGLVFAAGAAVTKQAGLYILAIYPFLVLLNFGWKKIHLWFKDYKKPFHFGIGAVVILVVPWYLMKLYQINMGLDISHVLIPVNDTSAASGSSDLWGKISTGFLSLGKYGFGFLVLLPALFLVEPAIRWIVILIVLPFTLLWAGYASYDVRNVTLVWPFLALAIGASLEAYLMWFCRLWERLIGWHRLRWAGVLVIVFVLMAAAAFFVPSSRLIQEQESLQKQILNPELNQKLYEFFDANPSYAKILTNYPVGFLPGFEGQEIHFGFNDLEDFEWAINQDDIGFLLVPNYAIEDVRERIQKGVESGEFTRIFSTDKFIPEVFYIINR
jgi:hypothetical protein